MSCQKLFDVDTKVYPVLVKLVYAK